MRAKAKESERKRERGGGRRRERESTTLAGEVSGRNESGEGVKRWLTWNTRSVTEIRRNFKVASTPRLNVSPPPD